MRPPDLKGEMCYKGSSGAGRLLLARQPERNETAYSHTTDRS